MLIPLLSPVILDDDDAAPEMKPTKLRHGSMATLVPPLWLLQWLCRSLVGLHSPPSTKRMFLQSFSKRSQTCRYGDCVLRSTKNTPCTTCMMSLAISIISQHTRIIPYSCGVQSAKD